MRRRTTCSMAAFVLAGLALAIRGHAATPSPRGVRPTSTPAVPSAAASEGYAEVTDGGRRVESAGTQVRWIYNGTAGPSRRETDGIPVSSLALTDSGGAPAVPEDPSAESTGVRIQFVYPASGVIRTVDGEFAAASYEMLADQPGRGARSGTVVGPDTEGLEIFSEEIERRTAAMRVDVALARERLGVGQDAARILTEAATSQNVEVRRRSAVSLEPHIRGFKMGQIYATADGAYWMAARPDMDTMLNKIDPSMVQDINVVSGPYGLHNGAGMAFVEMTRTPTPRNADGFRSEFQTDARIDTNGGRMYGRETVSGGASDWGMRMSYGDRRGSDYEAGNGEKIPSSYKSRDVWAEAGYDITPHQRLSMAFQRLDQTDVEYPGQFFDVGFLGSYGFQASYVDDDPSAPWTKWKTDAWYNRTRFWGNTAYKNNPNFPVLQRVEQALDLQYGLVPGTTRVAATTNGAAATSGARTAMALGEVESGQLTLGADLLYINQVIREDFNVQNQLIPIQDQTFFTNMPHARMVDPGLYTEWSRTIAEKWTLLLGARLDLVSTRADAGDLRTNWQNVVTSSLPDPSTFGQDDALYSLYLNNKFALDDHWTLTAGGGQSQRAPTLVERYADGLFLNLMQSGFNRVIGTPELNPERNWQMDVRLAAEYEEYRGQVGYFYSWVYDYITFQGEQVGTPPNFDQARVLRYLNTDLATLTGFDASAEYDLTRHLTPFARMSYVEGRDQAINAPLPSIPPLESTVGLRIHDPDKGRKWGLDIGARIVASQDRLGTLRLTGGTVVVEEATPGFAVCFLRSYYNFHKNLNVVAGIENLFDKTYQEHLDLRLIDTLYTQQYGSLFPKGTRVWEPGFTPYFGVNWIF